MKKVSKLLVLMLAGVMMFSLASCGSSDKGPGTAKDGDEVAIETAAMKLVAAKEAGGYDLVDTATMKEWVDNGEDMIVIDTMPADNFAKQHIPGAVNAELGLTMDEVTDEQKAEFVKALGTDKNKKIVVYCGFTACGRSNCGALIAKEQGFTNVVRYPGGIVAWQDAGYDVEADE